VSDTPRTFIYYAHYNSEYDFDTPRNLQDYVDVDDDLDHYSEWKDFRDATYVFPLNSPTVTYVNLANYEGTGYSESYHDGSFFDDCDHDWHDPVDPGEAYIEICGSPDLDRIRFIAEVNI